MKQLILLTVLFIGTIAAFQNTEDVPEEEPLFTLLDSDQTNIDFNNEIEDTPEHNITIYSNYYGGAGVGVGDINKDGLPDLFFAGNLVPDKLYLNKGNFEFEDITERAGISIDKGWSSGVLFGDVNGDGWQDIYVTRELYDDQPDLRRNKLYINNQDNTFSEQAEAYGIADDARTRHATFLDYDKDGDLDLFLLNQPPNPGDYSKFYNTELLIEEYAPKLYEFTGEQFVDVTQKAGLNTTGFPNSVTASDLNGDGWTDLFVANDFWVGDWYYINNGDGTFTNKALEYLKHTSFSSMGVDAADINNDGALDVMVVDMVAEDNYRQKANMSGMNPKAFWKVVNEGGHHQYMFNMLHLNHGNGQFSDIAQLANVASTDWSWSTLMADLDNDGWKDIFITNGLLRDIRNKDANKKFGAFIESSVHEYISKNPNPGNVSVWDIVDINKAMPLVPSEKLHNYAFRNNGDFTFSKKIESWGFEQKTFSNGAAYADLDNDGDLDLIVSNINDKAAIYQNNTSDQSSNHFLRVIPLADDPSINLFGTKLWAETEEGSQFFEITGVRGMYSTSEFVAHFGLGQQSMVRQLRVQWPDGKESVLKNIESNQVIELTYSAAKAVKPKQQQQPSYLEEITGRLGFDYTHEENIFDDYKMQVLLPHKMSTFGPIISVGDANGDGLDDFFVGGAATKPAALFVQEPDGQFKWLENEIFVQDKIHEDLDAAFFDADNDGDQDLYVVSGGNEFNPSSKSYQDRLYWNDGNGQFSKAENTLPEMIISGSKVRPMDYDQDGDIDLFIAGRHVPWAYPSPTSSVLLQNEGGKFMDVTSEQAPELIELGMVNDASWLDYNQDGKMDLVVAGEWMPITLFENKGDRFEKAASVEGLSEHTGWWFSVATADMDGDGDQDLIAGNLGLNYKYKASAKEPFEVYYYDFDDNKSKDIVLTYYNFGIQYPLRGLQCSSEQVPELKEKIPSYDIFASSDVFQVYGENELENALHYEATNFASTYFENLGDGSFERHPLPQEAQVSSINDLLIKDFTGDGHLDILLAGNLYNAEVETARNDAGFGLLLAGNGGSDFEVVQQERSGFYVPFNVKSLAIIKGANGPLVLVGCNNDRLLQFRN